MRVYQCVNNTVINQSRVCLVNKSEAPGDAHHDNAVGCLFRGAFNTSKQHSEHTCILASDIFSVLDTFANNLQKPILIVQEKWRSH